MAEEGSLVGVVHLPPPGDGNLYFSICIFVRIFTVGGSLVMVAHMPPPGDGNVDNSDGDAYFDF